MPLTTGLLSHWRLNEETKLTTVKTSGVAITHPGPKKDSVGTNHLTTVIGMAPTVATQVNFRAASKSGWLDPYCHRNYGGTDTTNSLGTYLRCPNNADFQLQNESFTWAFWLYIEPNGGAYSADSILGKFTETGSVSADYHLSYSRGSQVLIFYDNVGNRAISLQEFTAGSWQFVIVGRTGTTIFISVNNEAPVYTTGNPRNLSNTNFVSGAFAPKAVGVERYASYRLSSLSLWNRALTEGERTALWNSGAGLHFSEFGSYQPESDPSGRYSSPYTIETTDTTVEEDTLISGIRNELVARNWPCVLTLSDFTNGIVPASLRAMNRYYPIDAFATFETVEDIQDYFIFDPDNPDTGGFAETALKVKNVYWNPGGDWSSLNLFSPGWQMLSQNVIFTGSYFHNPSLMVALRQKLDSWSKQFGSVGFDILGPIGAASSVLRIYPVPRESGSTIGVEFVKGWELADINDAALYYFMQWVEMYSAEALSNKYATTAGIDLFGFKDSAEAMKYWRERYTDLKNMAINTQSGGGHGAVGRS